VPPVVSGNGECFPGHVITSFGMSSLEQPEPCLRGFLPGPLADFHIMSVSFHGSIDGRNTATFCPPAWRDAGLSETWEVKKTKLKSWQAVAHQTWMSANTQFGSEIKSGQLLESRRIDNAAIIHFQDIAGDLCTA